MAQSLDIGRVTSAFRQRMARSIVASVHDYQQLTPKLARVIVCFNSEEADPGDRFAAVTAALGGKAVAVDDSFRPIPSNDLPAMLGFVRATTEVLDLSESKKRGMRALASNVLMDPSDESIWEVRHAAGSSMLVRQGVEDLASVLQTAKVHRQRTPVLSAIGLEPPEARRFVAFVDPNLNIVRYGYVIQSDLDTVEILPFPAADETGDAALLPRVDNDSEEMRGDGNVVSQRMADRCAPINVGMDNLVETAHMNGNDSFEVVAAPAGNEREKMIEYYRKVYGYAPDYYQKIVEIIQGHAGL